MAAAAAVLVAAMVTPCPMMRCTRAKRCAAFPGSRLNSEAVTDATSVLNYRHWLERRELTRVLFDEVGVMLEERGLLMRQSLPGW